jgi:hypothetical protein
VSSYCYIRVLVLLHTSPHTTAYVSSHYYIRVLIHYYIRVLKVSSLELRIVNCPTERVPRMRLIISLLVYEALSY